jgi:GNAT superfamily N-acetyltransferase
VSGYSAPRPITAGDGVAGFDSGEPSLDDYVRGRALANHAEGASRCFVTCHQGRVVGFYALASAAVHRASVPGRVGRNMPDPVPAILLSRLAIDAKHQGQGLDAQLLRDAITRAAAAAEIIGVPALLVHDQHEQARAFYANFDFEPSPTDRLHLLLLIDDACALLDPQR